MIRSVAHVSDLHLGRDRASDAAVRALASALVDAEIDALLVTGDVTHRGRAAEMRAFEDAFAPLLERGRVVVVPGNHDRAGEDVGATLMVGSRVGVADLPGLHVVRVDSTAPHNRSLIAAHGMLEERELREVDAALRDAPAGAVSVVMLHHHVLPLPADDLVERLSGWLGWPHAEELPRGRALVNLALGRCDLLLHGHRHLRGEAAVFPRAARPLAVVNAGCSPELGGARAFLHEGGALRGSTWISVPSPGARARRGRVAA